MRLLTPLGVTSLDHPPFLLASPEASVDPIPSPERMKKQNVIVVMRGEDALQQPGQPSPAC